MEALLTGTRMGNAGAVLEFDDAFLDALSARAAASPRLRQHHNIHASFDDPCQRFLNAMEPGTYLQPNRHALVPRAKLLTALRGCFAAVLFDDRGNVTRVARFAAAGAGNGAVAIEIAPATWNTVLPLETRSVLLEVKAGPFDPAAPREVAPWAPAEGGKAARGYLAWLRRVVKAWPGRIAPFTDGQG